MVVAGSPARARARRGRRNEAEEVLRGQEERDGGTGLGFGTSECVSAHDVVAAGARDRHMGLKQKSIGTSWRMNFSGLYQPMKAQPVILYHPFSHIDRAQVLIAVGGSLP